MRLKASLLAVVLAGVSASSLAHDQNSMAHYIANEAILVSHGETKVLFDPLPLSGFDVYPVPSDADINAMMRGDGIYEGVDIVFISHAHADHFSPKAIFDYMQARPDVKFVMPQQAVDLMQDEFLDEAEWTKVLQSRITALEMAVGDNAKLMTIGSIQIGAVRIPHAGWPAPARASVQNMVYRVSLDDGATIIHMGDADPRLQHFAPHQDHWQERRTDTAFPPYWFLLSKEGRSILSDEMNVANSIGIHVPIDVPADLKTSGQDYLSIPGETREIGE